MTVVRARLAPGRSIDADDFADITAAPVDEVAFNPDGTLAVTFTGELTQDEADRVRARIASADTEGENLLAQAASAYRANQGYLSLPAPTNAEVRDQVAALTRQMNGLIRLAVK